MAEEDENMDTGAVENEKVSSSGGADVPRFQIKCKFYESGSVLN